MGDKSVKDGIDAGKKGSDYSPPKHDFTDSFVGVTKKDVDEMKEDYKKGYEIGTQQKLADSNEKNAKK